MISKESLKHGALLLGILLLVFIGFYVLVMIGGLVVGTVSNTVNGGTINVSTAMKTHLNSTETNYISTANSLQNNAPLIVSLVAIVVIVLVFGFKFNFGEGGRGRGVE